MQPSERALATEELHRATAIYTRDPIVQRLLDHMRWPRGGRRLIEPSCGDGAFLEAALARLLRHQPHLSPSEVALQLQGWEIHPDAAAQARARLALFLVTHGWPQEASREAARLIVTTGDFLTEGPRTPAYDSVVGNPPYLRYANVPALLRQEYEALLPDHAQADLLHSFLDRAADILRPDGEIAFVTADRWLFNTTAKDLRTRLGQTLAIAHMERLDVTTAFYRPKLRKAGTPPRIHPVSVVLRAGQGSIPLTAAAVYPDAPNGPSRTAQRLRDIASVRLAPWLGTKGIFVVDAGTAATFPEGSVVPAVDTDDIVNGVLQEPTRYAIRSSPDVEPPAEVLAWLDANLHRMAPRGRRNPRWLPPETWHKLQLDEPRLLVPRIAKRLKAIRLPPGVLPINHNLSVIASGKRSLEVVEAALLGRAAQEYVTSCAPRLEGGYYSITTNFLRNMPVETP